MCRVFWVSRGSELRVRNFLEVGVLGRAGDIHRSIHHACQGNSSRSIQQCVKLFHYEGTNIYGQRLVKIWNFAASLGGMCALVIMLSVGVTHNMQKSFFFLWSEKYHYHRNLRQK